MPKVHPTFLPKPRGYQSAEVASFVAQLDDRLRILKASTRDLTRAELEWQPKRGFNSIGMLMAHNAIVEVYWVQVGVEGRTEGWDVRPILGIGEMDDGLPAPPTATHPKALKGKELPFYDDLLARARRHTVRRVKGLAPEDLERRFRRRRMNGEIWETDLRWMLYHLVEHFAAHEGQIGLLRHLYRDRRNK